MSYIQQKGYVRRSAIDELHVYEISSGSWDPWIIGTEYFWYYQCIISPQFFPQELNIHWKLRCAYPSFWFWNNRWRLMKPRQNSQKLEKVPESSQTSKKAPDRCCLRGPQIVKNAKKMQIVAQKILKINENPQTSFQSTLTYTVN